MRLERSIHAVRMKVRALLRREDADRELDEELRYHVEQKTEENIARGMDAAEARRAALIEAGGIDQAKEKCRDVRGVRWIQDLVQDLRLGLRRLWNSPGFAITSILTLALGIAAVTSVFSVVNTVILQPYRFRNPGQLIVWQETMQEISDRYPVIPDNYRHYLNLKSHSTTISDAAIFQNATFGVSVPNGHPEILKGLSVSENFFSVLGVQPMLGRAFLKEETQPGRDDEIILSWSAWNRFFNRDPGAIGKRLDVGQRPRTVVGILPKSFVFPALSEMPGSLPENVAIANDIFRPLVPQPDDLTSDDGGFSFLVIARLLPGITQQQAGAELDGMQKSYSAANHLRIHLGVFVESIAQKATGTYSEALWLLFAAVSGVLLIACVNLASLQLARAVARDRDNALRAALGAAAGRLFQTALSESLVLSAVGGVSGALLAYAGVRLFVAFAPPGLQRLNEVHVSPEMLFFAATLSALTAIVFGTFPSLRAARTDPQNVLQSGASRVIGARKATAARRLLVAFEISCTVVLLVTTGLVARSFSQVVNQDRDFNPSHVVVAQADLLAASYWQSSDAAAAARSAFIDGALDRLRAIPGVEDAAITSHMPLAGDENVYSVYRPDLPLPENEVPTANVRNITPGYLSVMQIPLIAGRDFQDDEREHPADVMISQNVVNAAWPGENPLGRTCRINGRVYKVIGIAADARIVDLKKDAGVVYLPYWHDPPSTVFFLVRSSSMDLKELAPLIRSDLWTIDPGLAIPTVKSLDAEVAEWLNPERFQTLVLSCFGVAALLLAALGLYGVLAYSVSLRSQEFGIRMALGSSKSALLRLVLREAAYPVFGGLLAGAIASVAAARIIRNLLYETQMSDPLAIGASFALLLSAALVACWIPARRAMRVDPMVALRHE